MYCPQCRAEFREEITTCPDCEVSLVVELPEMSELSDEDLVSVLETADVAVLPVVKSVLRAANIPFVVQGDEAMGVLPVGRVGFGGISAGGHGLSAGILVPRDREEEARALLTELTEPQEE
jgi:hypothetical protein